MIALAGIEIIMSATCRFERIFDALRQHGTETSYDVAAQAMRDKGLDPEHDKPARTDLVRRVGLALGDVARKGKVEKIGRARIALHRGDMRYI
jgi:hypothetical protein